MRSSLDVNIKLNTELTNIVFRTFSDLYYYDDHFDHPMSFVHKLFVTFVVTYGQHPVGSRRLRQSALFGTSGSTRSLPG